MTNRNIKIVKQYLVGLCYIVFFFLLENSSIIPYLLEKTNKLRYKGFVTFIITGLIKYGLLFYGIIVIVILSFLLIKEKLLQYDKKINREFLSILLKLQYAIIKLIMFFKFRNTLFETQICSSVFFVVFADLIQITKMSC